MHPHASTWRGVVFIVIQLGGWPAYAADWFEIQVFHAEKLNKPKQVSLELHSNFIPVGLATSTPPEVPTDGVLYENLEPVVGLTRWWEIGVHLEGAARPSGFDWGGIRLRTQFHFPIRESKLPLHLGLNLEGAYVPPHFDAAQWIFEVRPILELNLGHWDIDFNPVLIFPLAGANPGVPRFEPALALRYDFDRGIGVSVEYYGAIGQLNLVLPVSQEGHHLFAAADVVWSRWSVHLGIGRGLTPSSNPIVLTSIVECRLN